MIRRTAAHAARRRPPHPAGALDAYDPEEGTASLSFAELAESFPVTAARINLLSAYFRARSCFDSDAALARALEVDRTRLSAWKKAQAEPRTTHLRLLGDLATVGDVLRRILHPATIQDWLTTRQPELDGATPVEALRDGRLAEVLLAANATEHGAFG
jgi:hypothetical protein